MEFLGTPHKSPQPAPTAAMGKHSRPEVSERPLDGSGDAARLGISADKLSLLMKLMSSAMDTSSPHEAARATRLLKRKLAELHVSDADADAVLRPSSDADLLKQGGIFEVHLKLLRLPSWLEDLSMCMCDLLGVRTFWQRTDKAVLVGFYGEHGSAATAAHLFVDVYASVWRLSDAYSPQPPPEDPLVGAPPAATLRQSRADYRASLVSGYQGLCRSVTRLRQDAAAAAQLSADAKRAKEAAAAEAAAELESKKKLRKEAAQAVLREEGGDSDGEGDGGGGWVPPPMASSGGAGGSRRDAACDDDDEDDVQILEVVSAEEVRKRKLAAAFGPGGDGVVLSDDDDDQVSRHANTAPCLRCLVFFSFLVFRFFRSLVLFWGWC